jgi:hypothetical protein
VAIRTGMTVRDAPEIPALSSDRELMEKIT